MLGVRTFACRGCATVYAGPAAPPACGECGADRFRELTGDPGAVAYFRPAVGED